MRSLYDNFLKHLKVCGGCMGPRTIKRCQYAIVCATAERLAQKGLVRDSKSLRDYGSFNRKHICPTIYSNHPNNSKGADVGNTSRK